MGSPVRVCLRGLLSSVGFVLSVASILPSRVEAAMVRVASGLSHAKLYEVYRSDQPIRWSDAQEYATTNLLAKLVSIGDSSENAYISTLIADPSLWVDSKSPQGHRIGPYIGLRQTPGSSEPKGGWRWENLTSMSAYSNWYRNQPDNYSDDDVGVFYNGNEPIPANIPWGDVLDSWTLTKGPYAPGPNPFLAQSFVVEYPFSLASIVKVASGINDGSRYEVYRSDTRLPFSHAETYARIVLGTKLAVIKDATKNVFISSLITDPSLWVDSNSPAGNHIGPYIGLYQQPGSAEPEGGWFWVDGTPLSGYTNWFFNQPDNYNDDNVALYYNGFDRALPDSQWGDVVNGWNISVGPYSPGRNPFLANSFVVQYQHPVPGPLPLMAAFAAFRCTRQLRRRCQGLAPSARSSRDGPAQVCLRSRQSRSICPPDPAG
jgi:hypothetical protein